VDNTEDPRKPRPFTTIEFCAGYAGISLGLKRVIPNLRIIAYSEIEAFACANLVAKMEAGYLDTAPIWTDLKTFPSTAFHGKVDLLVGGYPCQPFSAAGKRQEADDPRHLWPYIRDAIRLIQPRYCFFENVEGHISLGLSTVISDLEEDGYKTTWGIFSAEEVGAPHRRKRVFILAQSKSSRSRSSCGDTLHERGTTSTTRSARLQETARWSDGSTDSDNQPTSTDELAHPSSERLQGLRQRCEQEGRQTQAGYAGGGSQVWPSRPGEPQHEWEPPRVVDTGLQRPQKQGQQTTGVEQSGQRVVGDTEHNGHATTKNRGSSSEEQEERRVQEPAGRCEQAANNRQIEPPLGRSFNGSSDRMGDAELCKSRGNRTDELRLLGNGVVPATAELAWRVLYARLKKEF